MSRHSFRFAVCMTGILAATALAAPPTAAIPPIPQAPTLIQPGGAYQIAWLELAGGGEPVRVFLALRDGKPVQFWSLQKQLPGLPKAEGTPKLLTDGLRGQTAAGNIKAHIDLRLVSIWAPMRRLGMTTLSLDLKAQDTKLTGTWSTTGEKPANGQVSGLILDEASARQANAIAPGQDWPWFYGTLSACRGPDYGKPMVDDLAAARPLWRSETVSLSGWGTGVDARYKTRAAYGTLCGGSSSPVVADGLVYLYHYRPSGDADPQGPDAEQLARFDHPQEREGFRRFFSTRADVVVSCIDGATGKTVWESVWPLKQGNYQTHKWRGNNHTPAIARGTLVVSDYSWGLYAHDAKTGQLKWSRGGGGPVPHDHGAVGPVISGDVVVWATSGGTLGLDLATGKPLWNGPAAGSARRMVIDGKERILLVGQTLILIDPASGQVLARADYPGGIDKKGRKDVGRGPGANLVCDGPYIVSFETVKVADKNVGNIFALKVAAHAIEPAWTNRIQGEMEDGHVGICIANGQVYTGFRDRGAYCIDLATGKTIKNLPEFTAHSNPTYIAVDNRVFWQPECQHGRQRVQLFEADKGTFAPLGANWSPPHNDTTAYGEMPISNVVVDGRLIIRGMDGIYCYDLRKQPAASGR